MPSIGFGTFVGGKNTPDAYKGTKVVISVPHLFPKIQFLILDQIFKQKKGLNPPLVDLFFYIDIQ